MRRPFARGEKAMLGGRFGPCTVLQWESVYLHSATSQSSNDLTPSCSLRTAPRSTLYPTSPNHCIARDVSLIRVVSSTFQLTDSNCLRSLGKQVRTILESHLGARLAFVPCTLP